MTPDARFEWEEMAGKDKERYMSQMKEYRQACSAANISSKMKDPTAPKRPMSAFLAFSNERRAGVKRNHPELTNADLSKALSKQWRECDPVVKAKYVDEEAKLRAQYKKDTTAWKKDQQERNRELESQRVAAGLYTDTEVQAASPSTQQQQHIQAARSSSHQFPGMGFPYLGNQPQIPAHTTNPQSLFMQSIQPGFGFQSSLPSPEQQQMLLAQQLASQSGKFLASVRFMATHSPIRSAGLEYKPILSASHFSTSISVSSTGHGSANAACLCCSTSASCICGEGVHGRS